MTNQKKAQGGFTLIELMIVIAIVGILAAIALPAYQDYIIRAKMSEPMAALAEAKTTVSEYIASNGDVPDDFATFGVDEGSRLNSDIFDSIDVVDGSPDGIFIVARVCTNTWLGGDVCDATADFSIVGTTVNAFTLDWTCQPGDEAGTADTDAVPTKYLPANCRGQ